jgi:cysteinyl-tRNA synthetase
MTPQLQLYDTMTRVLKTLAASGDRPLTIYCCGPTVYRDAHVGNFRTFLLSDLVIRTLHLFGQPTRVVQNITDVGHMAEDLDGRESGEDKLLTQAATEAKDPFEVAREYEARFHRDLALLAIQPADQYPRASESIDLMQKFISALIDRKSAYLGSDGSVYFAANSFDSYGALSGNRLDALKPGHRYEYVEDGAKKFHADWALWKAAGNRTQMIWPSPWGPGFPGWHIECSAMSLEFLGPEVDLHIGGIDLRFPHHEDERAQSNSVTGTEVVAHWLHGEHLLFEGRKMSKSAGNVVLVGDLIDRGFDPLVLRLALMENRYRAQMDLTWKSIEAASATLTRWRKRFTDWSAASEIATLEPQEADSQVLEILARDLDTPRLLIYLRDVERDPSLSERSKYLAFATADKVLALNFSKAEVIELDDDSQSLLNARAQARAAKDFATSDQLRDLLAERGITVRDGADGQNFELTELFHSRRTTK